MIVCPRAEVARSAKQGAWVAIPRLGTGIAHMTERAQPNSIMHVPLSPS
jgi:hypothetical protein